MWLLAALGLAADVGSLLLRVFALPLPPVLVFRGDVLAELSSGLALPAAEACLLLLPRSKQPAVDGQREPLQPSELLFFFEVKRSWASLARDTWTWTYRSGLPLYGSHGLPPTIVADVCGYLAVPGYQ